MERRAPCLHSPTQRRRKLRALWNETLHFCEPLASHFLNLIQSAQPSCQFQDGVGYGH